MAEIVINEKMIFLIDINKIVQKSYEIRVGGNVTLPAMPIACGQETSQFAIQPPLGSTYYRYPRLPLQLL